jgi:hypothetical protein
VNDTSTTRQPLHPWLVFAIAAVLPGVGQVLNQTPQRGLVMVFFLIYFAMTSYQLTTLEHSWLVRHAGGVFMYGFILIDAYRFAKIRHAYFHRGHAESKDSGDVSQH